MTYMTADARAALSNLAHRSCESSLQSPNAASRTDALRLAAQTLNTAVQQSLFPLMQRVNDAAPINQLPREIFLQILLLLSLRDCILSSHVCRHWRSVALSCAQLWSDCMDATHRVSLATASEILARSGNAPVSLSLSVSDSCEALGVLLRQHMVHMRTLHLRVDLDAARSESEKALRAAPLLHALAEPAPLLCDLSLAVSSRFDGMRPVSELVLPDALFADAAPALRTVRLNGVALAESAARAYPALSAVRALSLTQLDVDVVQLLRLYPRLEQLYVAPDRLIPSGSNNASATVTAPNLTLLHIKGTLDAARLLRTQVSFQRPVQIWMPFFVQDLLEYVLATAEPLRRVRLYANFPRSDRCIELGHASGTTWVLKPSGAAARDLLLRLHDAQLLSGLTHLALHEVEWPLASRLRDFALPRLRQFDLVLDTFADPRFMDCWNLSVHPGLLYEFEETPSHAKSVLRCPLLEELHISAPTGLLASLGVPNPSLTLAVDVHDICRLVATRLRYDSNLRLVLRNVHLEDPTRGAGMLALTRAVDGIEYRFLAEPKLPELRDVGYMMSWVFPMYE